MSRDGSKQQRQQTVVKWLLGHALFLAPGGGDDTHVMLSVGEHMFTDRWEDYPSERLVAEVALALYSGEGLSPAAFAIADLDDSTAVRVLYRGRP